MKSLFTILTCLACFGAGSQTMVTNYVPTSHLRFLNPTNPADAAEIKMQHLRQPIWVCFEEDGKVYMHGCSRDMSQGPLEDDFVTNFLNVKIEGEDAILFGSPCETNILIMPNYAGTIQVGTNFYTVKDLLKTNAPDEYDHESMYFNGSSTHQIIETIELEKLKGWELYDERNDNYYFRKKKNQSP